MIAEVYPFLRLPRRFSFFDYQIPDGVTLNTGDVVLVSFRGREVPALVKRLKDASSTAKLSTLLLLLKKSWGDEKDISRIETIARSLAQSPSSILHTLSRVRPDEHTPRVLSKGRSPSVQKKDVETVMLILKELESKSELAISGDKELGLVLAHALRKKTKDQVLILAPRERDAEEFAKRFSAEGKTALMHGKTPERDRSQIMNAWREGKIDMLIATRTASLIPAKKLGIILVLNCGCEDHLNARRNPRFDAREAAKLLAVQHGAKILFIDSLPRLEELKNTDLLLTGEPSPVTFISLKDRLEYSGDPFLTETLLSHIKTALQSQKKVLLFLNRKGVAKRLQCGACGHLPQCGTCGNIPSVRLDDLICDRCGTEMWIPKDCPSCGKPKIGLRGIGGTKIASLLQEKFPDAVIGRLEKGTRENEHGDILVVTEYFFTACLNLFAEKKFGLIADLGADIHLNSNDFRGPETAARKLHRLRQFAERQGATCVVQSYLPDVIEPMLDLKAFVKSELVLRKEYRLPPYTTRITLEGATTADLPPDAQALFTPRGDKLELRTDNLQPQTGKLPDKIKIVFDGPYVNHESTP